MDQKVEVTVAREDEKEILRNLMEKYLYEFSQYDHKPVNALGLYGYAWLDYYWTDKNRYPFLIKVDGALAGFALVGGNASIFKDTRYSMDEFFLLYTYRRAGIGTKAARHIFDIFPGIWELKCHPANTAASAFWHKIIREYTEGDFTKLSMCGAAAYNDGSYGDAYRFSTYPIL